MTFLGQVLDTDIVSIPCAEHLTEDTPHYIVLF